MSDYLDKGATLTQDGKYRYFLFRRWADHKDLKWCTFLMLNPSTADGDEDDPTIRRCVGFAKSWGFDGLMVVNVYAYRATNPKDLPKDDSRFGPLNKDYIKMSAHHSEIVVLAYGSSINPIDLPMLFETIKPYSNRLKFLYLSKNGHPYHPLYVPAREAPRPFTIPEYLRG